MLGVSVVQGPKQAIGHVKAGGSWKVTIEPTSKIRSELLTAFLPVQNVRDDGDVTAAEVDVDLRTGVLALRCRD